MVAQNNAIRINNIKAKIDNTQTNSKCWLCGDRDETVIHTISIYSKLSQKEYKTKHDWVVLWRNHLLMDSTTLHNTGRRSNTKSV